MDSAIEDIKSVAMAIRDSHSPVQGNITVSECGAGLWHRVAYLNMGDPSQQCPSTWREYINDTTGMRACGRPLSSEYCPSKTYPVTHQYSRVCGRVIGYQFGSPDAFYNEGSVDNINQPYVNGISVTYGTPRKHIWTFAADWTERYRTRQSTHCPCKHSSK